MTSIIQVSLVKSPKKVGYVYCLPRNDFAIFCNTTQYEISR